MSTFVPSVHSDYGEVEVDTSIPQEKTAAEKLEQWAPMALDLLGVGDDPRRKLEKKEANLEALKKLHATAGSSVLRNAYAWQINKLTGEIEALKEQSGEARFSVWTTQAGKISGTLLLLGGTATALTLAWFFIQKGKAEQRK